MSDLFYLQIDLIPALALWILLQHARRNLLISRSNNLFQILVLITIFILVSDFFCWTIEGEPGFDMYCLLYSFNLAFFTLIVGLGCLWLVMVLIKLNPNFRTSLTNGRFLLVVAPFFLFLFFLYSSPWTGVIFTITEKNLYQRGPMFWVYFLIVFVYILAASIYALRFRSKTMSKQKKKDCMILSVFMVLPFVGGVIQLFFYHCSLFLSSIALSMVLIYINLQSTQISMDPLTNLTTRLQFDHYHAKKMKNSPPGKPWFIIMADVDHFKTINDRYGHYIGDLALRHIADTLSTVFQDTDAILSRYGGDEFMILVSLEDQKEADRYILQVREKLSQTCDVGGYPIPISLSIGCVLYRPEACISPKAMIKQADKLMYQEKADKHAQMLELNR